LGRTYSEEEVTDIMGRVDSQANVGKVESVAAANQRKTDDVMGHELTEVLARLLHTEDKDNGLLGPVGGLEEVVELDNSLLVPVGKILVHAAGVEVPDGRLAHDVHSGGTQDAEVECRIRLLHEPGGFATRKTSEASHGAEDFLHEELAGEGEDNGVKDDKGNIPVAFSVELGLAGFGGLGIGEEDEVVDRIRLGGVEGIEREEGEEETAGKNAVMASYSMSEAREQAPGPAALGESSGRIGLESSRGTCQ